MAGIYAVIVAAGRGTRFGGTLPKQYLPLGGGTVLRHAVAAFATHPRIAGVQVVIRAEDRAMFDRRSPGCASCRRCRAAPSDRIGAARAGGAGAR